MKEVKVNQEGYISDVELDDLELGLFLAVFDRPSFGKVQMLRSIGKMILERLGLQIVETEYHHSSIFSTRRNNPFEMLDLRYGEGSYPTTNADENGRVVRFIKREGDFDDEDKKRRRNNSFYGVPKPPGGWPKPYYFELDPKGLTPLEQDLIEVLLPHPWHAGGSRFDDFFQMMVKAVAELCRRLGLKPEFDETITEE